MNEWRPRPVPEVLRAAAFGPQIAIVKGNPAVVKTILAAGEEACRKAEFKQEGESDTETVDYAGKVLLGRKWKDAVRHREHRGEPGPG